MRLLAVLTLAAAAVTGFPTRPLLVERAEDNPFGLAASNSIPAILPPLGYPYDSLEPTISNTTMTIHHDTHHATYFRNLNAAIVNVTHAISEGDVLQVVRLTNALTFNGGGHILHSLFWRNLAPSHSRNSSSPGGVFPSSGVLAEHVKRDFSTLEHLQSVMEQVGLAVQGSGWVWLVYNRENGALEVIQTANQNVPPASQVPLLGIDVWEHAYWYDYRPNNRAGYLRAIWAVINWEEGEKRLAAELDGEQWW
ncbi:hypothetical protein JCM10450v2_006233 [Rhodotorula kratochvilovae]